MSSLTPWVADALVVAGLLVLTAAVVGMVRVRGFGVRLHAAAKAAFVGIGPLLLAAMLTGQATMIARATLILGFLMLTAPVATHALARAAYRRRRRPSEPARPSPPARNGWEDRDAD